MIPNITNTPNIMFGSTYKVSNHNNSKDGFLKFEDLCADIEDKGEGSVWSEEEISSKDLIWHKLYTLVVDNSKDSEVETYCANHGIKFSRYYNNQLLGIEQIKSRIKAPVGNLKLVEVDAQKLIKATIRQKTNIMENQIEYKKFDKTKTNDLIKSGLEFPTSLLSIKNNDPKKTNQEVINQIAQSGTYALKSHQLDIEFIKMTDEPDDKVFFALCDMGIDNIPLYMDKTTYDFAVELDLIPNRY